MNEKRSRLCGWSPADSRIMLRSNDCRRSKIGEKEITAPAGKGRRYAITFGERKKKKKIASADDDMLEFLRLSRKKIYPVAFEDSGKKSDPSDDSVSASTSASLKRDRGNRYSSKVRQRGRLFPFSVDIIMYHACKIYIYLLNPTRNLWPDSSVVPFYAVKPRFHSYPPPLSPG